MNLHDLARDPLERFLDQGRRPIRLRFGQPVAPHFNGVLLPQQLHVSEGLCEGLRADITCLTTRADLDVQALIGLPVEVGLVTDRGGLRRFSVIVTQARLGQGDGALTAVQLGARDLLGVMEQRRGNRVFLDKSVPEIARLVLEGWQRRCPALARCFDWTLLLDEARYPRRACTLQLHQSDADFLRGLLAREGIGWFFRPGADGHGATPRQELVLFDDAGRLPANAAGPLRYHHSRGTEQRDSIELLVPTHELVAGSVRRASWDHEMARVDIAGAEGGVDQGAAGNALAAALHDARIELPHAGADLADFDRLTRVALHRHAGRAQLLHGVGSVREQAVGEYNRIDGHPQLDTREPRQRELLTVRLQHWARSNLPKELDDRVQALLGASTARVPGWADTPPPCDADERYVNRFTAVQRDAPLAPAWDPRFDLPAMPLMTASVVGVGNVPVWCDELGRVKVQFHGLDPEDHEHAQGAGTNGNAGDSAWVRVNGLWCGPGFGVVFPLRPGMEVSIGFEMGDPSRPVIMGSRHHAANPPPRFDALTGLPHNHALSGIVTRELEGSRQQQLRFNDTRDHISVQLASDHAASQLNLGDLATPMRQGRTQPRGEGAELRSDATTAVRGAQGVLISSAAQPEAGGHHLAREELLGLLRALHSAVEQLGALADTHQAGATDPKRLERLVRLLQDWDKGSNIDPKAAGGGAGVVAVSAAAGAAIASQDNLLLGAQTHIDSVSVGHTQLSAGGQIRQRAVAGLSSFAHQGGIETVAAQGPVSVQAHDGDIELLAARSLRLTAGAKVVIQAPEIELVSQGAATRWGGGAIYEQAREAYVVKSMTFTHSSGGDGVPAGVKAPGSGLKFDQQVVMRWTGTNEPMAHQRYLVRTASGATFEGVTDGNGLTQRFPLAEPYESYTVEPQYD
ncbi:type VI secretion system Vgr family protein [Azohydromonas caseinilytica]|uniref:Type VI secretion system tip protein VgrG n=1 Tax=Azohydromonas caseinilytica TaxID=2728836 RepID=A0A848F5Q4_9BURK|nr:type VI secretion system Vgr family protein [Azohydromonas caseinilytica]NML14924.1 type VI secretion system tip protein VgrG [Azohydromonas caseinilytica]